MTVPRSESPEYSLVVSATDAGDCSRCGAEVGHGPIGRQGDQPLCDWCLIDKCPDLGMLLIMTQMSREIGRLRKRTDDPNLSLEAMTVYSTFASFYDQSCSWPSRVEALVQHLGLSMSQAPGEPTH